MVYNVRTEDIITIPLIGHTGNVTSLKVVQDIIYSTSDSMEIIAWNIENNKAYILDQQTSTTELILISTTGH